MTQHFFPVRALALVLGLLVVVAGCASPMAINAPPDDTAKHSPRPFVELRHPDWTKAAVLYELNTRQFTSEGTFRAAERELPRLKALGVDIVWLMPVHPIGETNRKGSRGSPYSVKDYYGVNPEFGSLADLRSFVDHAHALGLKVILDWVANHSAWDNPLVAAHPDWYERDWKGNFRPTPWYDWSDIIDFDYSKPAMRQYMAGAMSYWVRDVGVDGFRCDVAGMVPLDFWETVRAELDAIKPVFLLAEWESRDLHARGFDASYAWSWWDAVRAIAQGHSDATSLYGYYSWNEGFWPQGAMRLLFTENHDKNAWEATQYEAFGNALPAAIALSVLSEGIPLVHNGQEAGNTMRLAFFEKDPIVWRDHSNAELFRWLFALKKAHPALWNGAWGGRMTKVDNSHPEQVFSFVRERDGDRVLAAFNLSAKAVTASFPTTLSQGAYVRHPDGATIDIDPGRPISLPAWGYMILTWT